MTRIAITGANGRMGKTLLREVLSQSSGTGLQWQLAGASVRGGSEYVGQDIGAILHQRGLGLKATDDLDTLCQVAEVVVDFTRPELSVALAARAVSHGTALVLGTTGFDAAQQAAIDEAARKIPILQAANMSIGVNLLAMLVEQAARLLGPEYDIELMEMHHRHKVDAPSGTALMLGQAAAAGRAVALEAVAEKVRDGITGVRKEGNIGFATLRGGDVVGDHTVIFAGAGERLELSHKASSRDLFAQGAIRAAAWLVGRPAGIYTMRDMLALA